VQANMMFFSRASSPTPLADQVAEQKATP